MFDQRLIIIVEVFDFNHFRSSSQTISAGWNSKTLASDGGH
jgi:hypothetical protein